jgi:hypothetical protein
MRGSSSRLHPLIARVKKAQRRLTNAEVERLPWPDLVRYCDSLLTEDAAIDILINCFAPPSHQPDQGQIYCPYGHPYQFSHGLRHCPECHKRRARERLRRAKSP